MIRSEPDWHWYIHLISRIVFVALTNYLHRVYTRQSVSQSVNLTVSWASSHQLSRFEGRTELPACLAGAGLWLCWQGRTGWTWGLGDLQIKWMFPINNPSLTPTLLSSPITQRGRQCLLCAVIKPHQYKYCSLEWHKVQSWQEELFRSISVWQRGGGGVIFKHDGVFISDTQHTDR